VGVEVQIQRLKQTDWEDAWEDRGIAIGEPKEAIERLAPGPGIYRCREVGSDLWHFFYVDEDGNAVDSGAESRLK
jgi:hypothetical protein